MSSLTNKQIAEKFRTLAKQYTYQSTSKNLKFKGFALQKAAKTIEEANIHITSGNIAKEKLGISDKIAGRIDEIIQHGTLLELQDSQENIETPVLSAYDELCGITGIGPKRAKTLVEQGFDSISKLRQGVIDGKVKLTHHIQLGLKWYEDLNERIPREEVAKLEVVLKNVLKKIDPKLILMVTGSYRRGRQTCGDIDCLITLPFVMSDKLEEYGHLKAFVEKLHEIGFLVGDLTTRGDKKYMGICQLEPGKSKGRRIDIRCVGYDNYFAAMIYFTGSKNFNIDIRRKALEKGFSLNEYGFTNKETGEKVLVHSEEELFQIIGMDFVLPSDRDI